MMAKNLCCAWSELLKFLYAKWVKHSRAKAKSGTPDIELDPRDSFKSTILSHYQNLSRGEVPLALLDPLCERLTDYFYAQYSQWRIKYPAAIKRYSTFCLDDLDHPYTMTMIVNFMKAELKQDYKLFTRLLLNMSEDELEKFEQSRADFERMF